MITGAIAGRGRGSRDVPVHYAEGRALTAPDEGTTWPCSGSDIARKYDKHVGDTIVLKGMPFEVVGVLEPTLTAPDQAAIGAARGGAAALSTTLPPVVQASSSRPTS